jgi:hypothetical protein
MFDISEFLKGPAGGMGSIPQDIFAKSGGISQPSSGDMHIDTALTDVSLAFLQDSNVFGSRRAFRSVPVRHRGDVYWTYPRGAFNRSQMEKRAPGTESASATYQTDTAKYYCDVYALHVDIADQVRDNADSAFDMDRDATTFLTLKSLLLEELDWRDKFFGGTGFSVTPGAVWTYVADGVASSPTALGSLDFVTNATNNNVLQWSATPGAGEEGPIEVIRRAKRVMQQNTGFRPNIMVLGREVIDVLYDHPDIVGRLDSGQTPGGPAMTTLQSLTALFELDEIIIMDGIVNTAAAGIADSHSFIGGKNALLLYRPASPGLMTPAPGYTFLWSGFRGANSGGMRIKNIRNELIESDRIEIQSAFEHNQVSKELGFYFNGIVA